MLASLAIFWNEIFFNHCVLVFSGQIVCYANLYFRFHLFQKVCHSFKKVCNISFGQMTDRETVLTLHFCISVIDLSSCIIREREKQFFDGGQTLWWILSCNFVDNPLIFGVKDMKSTVISMIFEIFPKIDIFSSNRNVYFDFSSIQIQFHGKINAEVQNSKSKFFCQIATFALILAQ